MKKNFCSRRDFLKVSGLAASVCAISGCAETILTNNPDALKMKSPRPNILWISTEDIGPHLGCYGGQGAMTPTLDRLAAEGVRYDNAFVTVGVCAPTRSSIITGLYATTLGTHHMRAGGEGVERSLKPAIPSYVRCFSEYLRLVGYYCTNNSKQDYNFTTPGGSWDESSKNAHWRNRPDPDQNFFAVFNYTGTHEGSVRLSDDKHAIVTKKLTEDQRQDPAKVSIPPYYPDTPVVRKQWAKYLELITAMDYWVEDLLRQLDEDGLADDTIVMFWSDHGPGMPRQKRWPYDSGTRIPLIVRMPEKFRIGSQGRPGTVEPELVSSVDFAPTVLNLAKIEIPDYMQGRPFLGPSIPPRRRYIFTSRDRMDERYDIIRSVRDRRFRYVRNYQPYKAYYQYIQSAESGPVMQEIRKAYAQGTLPGGAEQFMADTKPIEELYDIKNDPHEINNLADDSRYENVLRELRGAHIKWMVQTRDMGLVPEPVLVDLEKRYGSRYEAIKRIYDDQNRRRLFYTAAIAGRPNLMYLSKFIDALNDNDPALRFWGAIGLGNMGDYARPALDFIKMSLQEGPAVVRVAVARALCRLDQEELGLKVLMNEIQNPQEWVRLHAALVLDELGEKARDAVPVLQEALNDKQNKYVVRVANHALNKLLGTNNRVR